MNAQTQTADAELFAAEGTDSRPWKPAMLRGWQRKCPCCGTGPMMKGYLTVRDSCAVCGEDLHHHRADDGPAYLTILVVGKLLMVLFLWVFIRWEPEPLVMIAGFSVLAVAMSLYLLPRFKGAIVGLQWAHRMYGFGPADGQPKD
ncbi:DUF983 domain-containing protein [Roseicitreum antarcticum]|uniref:Uncharacterized conserved protein, DUF983 family n=1 Tax=Roseicitreum antarcticum TaxID=564137 RepID=A0A1H3C3G2_9RHOB|nr:DUF983 domain-containing protein [Roseicitreum antarcticum]SDX48703.1 Uncharacterized conserved protein, DUF983 family [Roseicitreum antarcticum]